MIIMSNNLPSNRLRNMRDSWPIWPFFDCIFDGCTGWTAIKGKGNWIVVEIILALVLLWSSNMIALDAALSTWLLRTEWPLGLHIMLSLVICLFMLVRYRGIQPRVALSIVTVVSLMSFFVVSLPIFKYYGHVNSCGIFLALWHWCGSSDWVRDASTAAWKETNYMFQIRCSLVVLGHFLMLAWLQPHCFRQFLRNAIK